MDLNENLSARRREFEGVGKKIDQNLAQANGVADQNVVCNRLFYGKGQPVVGRLLHQHAVDVGQHAAQGEGICRQLQFSAFNVAHVQNVVDEAKQIFGGGFDFGKVAQRLLRQILRHSRQVRQAHNGVHGRADLMAHVGEKFAFGPAFSLGPIELAAHGGSMNAGAADQKDGDQKQREKQGDHRKGKGWIGVDNARQGERALPEGNQVAAADDRFVL